MLSILNFQGCLNVWVCVWISFFFKFNKWKCLFISAAVCKIEYFELKSNPNGCTLEECTSWNSNYLLMVVLLTFLTCIYIKRNSFNTEVNDFNKGTPQHFQYSAGGNWQLSVIYSAGQLLSLSGSNTHIRAQCVVRRLRTHPNRGALHLWDKKSMPLL